MKRTILILAILALFSTLSATLRAESDVLNSETGIIRIFVENEDGTPAAHAPVYISDDHKLLHIDESDEMGVLSLTLQEGQYQLSSAIIRPIADSLDRYSSPTAKIHVRANDTTTIILALHLGDDAISNLSLSTLKKIGVADEVVKYLN